MYLFHEFQQQRHSGLFVRLVCLKNILGDFVGLSELHDDLGPELVLLEVVESNWNQLHRNSIFFHGSESHRADAGLQGLKFGDLLVESFGKNADAVSVLQSCPDCFVRLFVVGFDFEVEGFVDVLFVFVSSLNLELEV